MNGTSTQRTGLQAGLLGCHSCGQHTKAQEDVVLSCSRCGEQLHLRHPNSINRAAALLIAAVILYIPANLIPITLTTALGKTEGDTIMQGVIYFLGSGEWPIALVIFTASIMVPTLKIISMTYLLISAKRSSHRQRLNRAKIFRAVEFVGRWSMIDVFVVTIMVALVQMGAVANVEAGQGAIYFCAVVILTMLAAESFDSRLIWDGEEPDE